MTERLSCVPLDGSNVDSKLIGSTTHNSVTYVHYAHVAPDGGDRVMTGVEPSTWHGADAPSRSERLTAFNHPALAHYTPEQIVNGDVESVDLELIRDLEDPDSRPELM